MKTKKLVIVESPAKCKKIEGFLGDNYKCIASFGHLRELPSLDNIDIGNQFQPTFTFIAKKEKTIQSMKGDIQNASEVILATDDDREGEAIAWHICDIFGLPVASTPRIVFHEITKNAVCNAMDHPTRINMSVVHAQFSRQILDVIVGFMVSPVLWKHIAHKSLSAGRCQTPALRLIYENEEEIKNATPTGVHDISGLFKISGRVIEFKLSSSLTQDEQVCHLFHAMADFTSAYSVGQPILVTREPPMPFNTSRLQQAASNELHVSPKQTMQICQKLYEAGHITYMRTENQEYSQQFMESMRTYIEHTYGDAYVNADRATSLKNDGNNPHEAIRPTNIQCVSLLHSEESFSSKEVRMYELIHRRTLQSVMSVAKLHTIEGKIPSPDSRVFSCKRHKMLFPGWKIVETTTESNNDEVRDYHAMITCPQSIVTFTRLFSIYRLQNSKQHYTEARLVHLLEEKGIGRPSTFSSLVEKIQERGYVKKQNIKGDTMQVTEYEMGQDNHILEVVRGKEFGSEKNKLVLQPLGALVSEFLHTHFHTLFAYEYTKHMEESLDKIASWVHKEGNRQEKVTWWDMLSKYHREITDMLDTLKENKPAGKIAYSIDEHHSYIIGKNGPVIKFTKDGKTSFKSVRDDIDVHKLEKGEYVIDDVVAPLSPDHVLGEHLGHSIALKKGKYGLYAMWGNKKISLKPLGNRPVENIRLEEVIQVLDNQENGTRILTNTLSIRTGKRGAYIFHKLPHMKKPSFFSLKDCPLDYFGCEQEDIKRWIFDTHAVG